MSSGRWAIQWPSFPPHPNAVPEVHNFDEAWRRDAWVLEDLGRRRPVGKRHYLVKQWRKQRQER